MSPGTAFYTGLYLLFIYISHIQTVGFLGVKVKQGHNDLFYTVSMLQLCFLSSKPVSHETDAGFLLYAYAFCRLR